MQRIPLVVILTTVISTPSVAAPKFDRENADHLVPVGRQLESAYEKLLARNLYVTPANYARIVILPSAGAIGETALTLHSGAGGRGQVILTCTHAQRNLWSEAFHLDVALTRAPTVRISRSDVPFPEDLAGGLRDALKALIRQRHEPRGTDRIIIHGTDFLFSVDDARGRVTRALLAPESAGRISASLRRVAELLEQYCESTPRDRAALAEKISAEAWRLGVSR
jgi:hypothetical protein